MREFILRALKSWTSPFNPEYLEKAGNMNIVVDCIVNSLWISSELRQDSIVHVVLEGPSNPPKTISFYGNSLRHVDYYQKSIASVINNALKLGKNLKLNEELEVQEGVKISKRSFESLVKEKSKTLQLFYLHQKGQDIREIKFNENVTFVFGDYIGMPRKTEKLLDRLNATRISLGPKMLFASQCVTLVNNELDRKVYK